MPDKCLFSDSGRSGGGSGVEVACQRKRFIFLAAIIVLIAIVGMGASSCPGMFGDPMHFLVIENQTQQTLTICYESVEIGTAIPGGNVTIPTGVSIRAGIIAAKNSQGELVFLRYYTPENYKSLGHYYYKAVIPPDIPLRGLANIGYSITNPTDIKLTVYVNKTKVGDVGPNDNITGLIPVDWLNYVVSARDVQGQTAFSKKFTFETMEEFTSQSLKADITVPYIQITFQNDTDIILDVYIIYVNYDIGNLNPGETITKIVPRYKVDMSYIVMRASDLEGNVIFSKIYSHNMTTELVKTGWKVIFTPNMVLTPLAD
jgi:hypothetical protein